MNRAKNKKNQKGESLLFTILVMSFIMGISLAVSYILFQEIKITRDIGNSVVAFYAAETGVEELMMTSQGTSACFDYPYSSICYRTQIDESGQNECSEDVNYCLQSTGSYQNTNRAIELQY